MGDPIMLSLFLTDLAEKKMGGTLAKQGRLGEHFLYSSDMVKPLKIKCSLFILSFKDHPSIGNLKEITVAK